MLAWALGIALTAQQPSPGQRPVFRAGTALVSVDAYPRKDGRVVEGLSKDDFAVWEDGKPQIIETFEFVRTEPMAIDDDRRDPTSVADANRQAADPRNRLFVIYLDLFHVSFAGSHAAKDPILTFLKRTLAQNDLFAVMTPEVVPDRLTFARRTDTIEAELTKHWNWGGAGIGVIPRNELEGRLDVCAPDHVLVKAYREELSSWSLQQLVIWLGGLRDERKNILLMTEGLPRRRASSMARGSGGSIPTIGVGPGGKLGVGANMSGMPDAAWCEAQAMRFSQIDYEQRFMDLLESARRANVSFYPVDLAGLRVGPTGAVTGAVSTLLTLAENTNGRAVVNTNGLVAGMLKITDELSAHYLLGYYSSNTAADGRFRRIEVKRKRSGEAVVARPGYLAPTEALLKAAAEAAARPLTGPTPVDLELGRLARIRADARLYIAAVASATTLDVNVELAARELEAGRFKEGALVTVTITRGEAEAKPIVFEGRIEPGARGAAIRGSLPAGEPRSYRVRAVVIGGDERLQADVEVLTGASGLIGEPSVFRAGTASRAPLRPVADFQFLRSERIQVEWPISKSLDERSARLLSRRGDVLPVPVTVTELTDGGRPRLAAALALAPLAAGDYVIELTVVDAGERVTRLIAFRVSR